MMKNPTNPECFTVCKRILTKAQVREIYEFFLAESRSSLMPSFVKRKGSVSTRLAAKYGVSPKTIRDIWNGITWTAVTSRPAGDNKMSLKQKDICDFLDEQVHT